MSAYRLQLFTLTIALLLASEVAHGQLITRTVAYDNEIAPGTSTKFYQFGLPAIDPDGNVSFYAELQYLTGPRTTQGIWSEVGGTLSLIARQGDVPPGYPPGSGYAWPTVVAVGAVPPISLPGGDVAFSASVNGRTGIWQGGSTPVVGSAVNGSSAPGTGGAQFTGPAYYGFRANRSGQIATLAYLNTTQGIPPENLNGIWMGAPGDLQYVASQNHEAAGIAGATYGEFKSPVLNNNNVLAFTADLNVGAGGVTSANNGGVWTGAPDNLTPVIRKGDVAPDTGGQTFKEFRNLSINDAGQVLVAASAFPNNHVGLWKVSDGAVTTVVAPDSPVPDMGGDVHFRTVAGPAINDQGAIAFEGFIEGTGINHSNETGIWLENNGQLHLLAQSGQPVPGTGGNVTFSRREGFDYLPIMNSHYVVFKTNVAITGVDGDRDAIFAYDMNGKLVYSLMYGQQIEVRPGNFQTITDLGLAIGYDDYNSVNPVGTGGQDGRRTSLSDTNQLAFYAGFGPFRNGVFVATIPEPSSLTMLAIGGLPLLLVWRLRLGINKRSAAPRG